jgi:YD repeat-containing protein
MSRRRPSNRTTWHYDRQGRLRARIGPDGVTRWTWDGGQLVGVSSHPHRTVAIPSTPNPDLIGSMP